MNIQEVWDKAREVMAPKCRVCPECNGKACKGEIPGLGGIGNGSSFTVCQEYLSRVKVLMNLVYEPGELDTSIELFGRRFAMPIFMAPIGGMDSNYNGYMTDEDFANMSILTLALAAALMLSLGIVAYSAGQAIFGWGGNMEIRSEKTAGGIENTVYVHTDDLTEPVSVENGRMYFIVNDEHIDITDQVSETEPYIYQFTDEENVLHYWIIGKNGPELEHYGFAEYLHPSESEWTTGYVARTNGNTAPWLDKAKEELGFDF